ncbi:PGAP1-domain-containing protein [Saccharata proteae CBS 121410]|uniref:GPI inositol-deacylase n=1 Tax=Saccharata proteae CBS 121410 TaxID=1314787 RepID=A0A6A5YFT1_9PEZI|nr:PGAP1-domain-containing protein [Saccharata proteae CBS 121410]
MYWKTLSKVIRGWVIFTQLIDRVPPPNEYATQTLVLAHRRELVEQAARHCTNAYPGKTVDIEMGNMHASGAADITVASVHSIMSSDRIQKFDPRRFKLVLVDEAHHIVARSYLEALDYFGLKNKSNSVTALVGVSATLVRFDGRKLGTVIDRIVYHKDYVEMIEDKWLSEVMFTTVLSKADLSAVKLASGGDFQTSSLSQAVNTDETNEITVRSYLARASDRKSTLVFCVDLAHLTSLTATFRRHGIDARYVTGETSNRIRAERIDAFKAGEYPVLLNCGVFTEGTDIPNIDCVILARPTRSRNLLIQMIGRGMRLHDGKKNCHVIDMVASLETGIVTTPTLLGLDPDAVLEASNMEDAKKLKERKEKEKIREQEIAAKISPDGSPTNSQLRSTVSFTDYSSIHEFLEDTSSEQNSVRQISNYAWVRIGEERYILSVSNIGHVIIDKSINPGKSEHVYTVTYTGRLHATARNRIPYMRPQMIAESSSLEHAIRAADTFAGDKFPLLFIEKWQKWRKAEASPAQLEVLNKLRDEDDKLTPQSVTKGRAQDMILRYKHGAKAQFKRTQVLQRAREREREKERKQPSGSATEEDEDCPIPDSSRSAPPTTDHNALGTSKPESLNDAAAARIPDRDCAPKDRRRNNETVARSSICKSRVWSESSPPSEKDMPIKLLAKDIIPDDMNEGYGRRRARWRNPWSCSWLTLGTVILAAVVLFTIVRSFLTRQLDPKGCAMSYMRPSFVKFHDFDTEHTRFASKYSLYLYREGVIDEDTRVKGVPVLFIPGNAGSYKQVRPLAAEAAYHFHDVLQHDPYAIASGKRALDFFSVDFNEDITAFHGQTLLDQAEYLNDAVAYILSLYHNPHRSARNNELPDPTSVIIVGHSMGGIVARTMLTMPNYQTNSINTILTLSAPHARPPVSFDAEIVKTYQRINDYWRHAYSQEWANDNPLWHVTLISIAGGGLDTIVPSDYASIASLVPETHGFTVFTSSIPHVWTGMDHLAITWCDQFRKSVIRSLYDVVDVSRPMQTRPRAERMRVFKKRFLTGLEDIAEKTLPHKEPKTLLTLEDNFNSIISQGERLTLRSLGQMRKPKAYLLPVPPQGAPEGRKFTLLTDQKLDAPGDHGKLEVLFCSVFPLQPGQSAAIFSMSMDLSGDSSGTTRLACKNAASDLISLPASTQKSKFPFDEAEPFSYLQYDLEDLADHQFVAVVDKSGEPSAGWVVAEFSAPSENTIQVDTGLRRLLSSTLQLKLPASRALVTDISIPALHSSLLAYKLQLGQSTCGQQNELFSPLLRQFIQEVYESKFYVNAKEADINIHGVAPYMPPPFRGKNGGKSAGLNLQLWSDPTCESATEITLKVDIIGSMGKLWMRYRTVFATFPLVAVALILRKQFRVYDETARQRTDTNHNFSNYTHSILILMLWILPINVPVLVVWIRNLAVHWLTPFSSHHNILSIFPFILLVETLSTGRMLPRIPPPRWARYAVNVGFFGMACYAAVYGVTYAYVLHVVGNGLAGWLVGVQVVCGGWWSDYGGGGGSGGGSGGLGDSSWGRRGGGWRTWRPAGWRGTGHIKKRP